MSKDYKETTNEKLITYYREHGKEKAISVARSMLQLNTHKDNKLFRAHLHGEICETVCEIILLDFMSKHKMETKDWCYSKGMILKDIENPDSGFLTEIDLTLFTNYQILTIECKSYGGDKTFTQACTVKRVGQKSIDVYKQHEAHYKCLSKTFDNFRQFGNGSLKVEPVALGYFNFSEGNIVDNRTIVWKNVMPIYDETNLENKLNFYLDKPTYWKMDYVKKVVNIIDRKKKENTSAHLKYVTDLHHK